MTHYIYDFKNRVGLKKDVVHIIVVKNFKEQL